MHQRYRHLRRLLWACGTILLVSQAFAVEQTEEFRLATAGYRYAFPRDHGAHEAYRTEWWYYTGQLTAKHGRHFGYQLTFFRRGMPREQVKTNPSRWAVSQLYLAHFAVSDLANQRFLYAEKISRAGLGKAGADHDQLHVWIEQWSADADQKDVQHLRAMDGSMSIQLTLSPEKPPVIHGENGISRKGSALAQASHYYSFSRLATSGTVTLGDESFEVTGTSWMDHEFGSADLADNLVGWDWFSLQLDDRSELMLYRLRRADGTADPSASGTYIAPDGRTSHLAADAFTLTPLTFWESPASKARYPQRWRLTIPSQQLSLELSPRMDDQELRTGGSTQVTYWEGAIEVNGVAQGRTIKGQGYMELTGYAERFSKKL
jgi:predicted secreted hydrolase